MSTHSFTNIPSWLVQPSQLHNVLQNQFASLKDVPSFTSLTNKTSFTAGFRQALYWRKRLSPSTSPFTVIFSFLGPQGLVIPNIPEVCQALRGIYNTLNITEIYRASNSHFIGITFSQSSDAAKFRSSFTYYSDYLVIHIPSSTPQVHNFKLTWLPPVFPDSRIHHFLQKHSIKHSFSRDVISTGPNSYSPTNSVTGTIELAPDANVTLIPHLIPLPAPHLGHAFLLISGRPSLCLRCGQVGHVRRSCSAPRCSSCHRYHLHSSPCSSSDPTLESTYLDNYAFDDTLITTVSAPPHRLMPSLPSSSIESHIQPSFATPDSHESIPHNSLLSSTPPTQPMDHNDQQSQERDCTFCTNSDNFSPKTPLITSIEISSTHDVPTVSLPKALAPSLLPSILQSQFHDVSDYTAPNSNLLTSLPALEATTDPTCTNDYFISSPFVKLDSGSSSSSSLSPSRKKLRPSSLSPKHHSISSDSSNSSHSDWSKQVDESYPLPPAPLSEPPVAALSHTPLVPQNSALYTFEELQPHPTDTRLISITLCQSCNHKQSLNWPIDDIYVCTYCDADLSINIDGHIIPYPTINPVYVNLSKSYFEDPDNLAYLKFCLANKVRLRTITTTKKKL